MDTFWQDVKFGARMLVKHRGVTFIAVLTLALAIGANTAMFSLVNGVLLNPLPFPEPEQLITLHQSKPNFDTGAMPYLNFRDLQQQNRTLSGMALVRGTGFSMAGAGEPERVDAQYVTADFFSVLGVKPAMGRTFLPGEDAAGAGPVALISADLWQRKFNGAADVLERSLTLDNKSYSIVGVIPASFNLRAGYFRSADVYVPLGQWDAPGLQRRGAALGLHGIGRLKPGVSIEQAHADLNRVMHDLAAAYPETNRGNGAAIIPMKEWLVGRVRLPLLMLFGAVGLVLLFASVNVSNLLLARSLSRTREFAIRTALGAGRLRLLRQLLTESSLLAIVGGGLGLLLAGWAIDAAPVLLPAALPRVEEIALNGRVLVFTLFASLLTGILAGLTPALKTSDWHLAETLKESKISANVARARVQSVFVAVEIALAVVVLVGAGLMVRSLSAAWNVDPGFRPGNVLAFSLNLDPSMRSASAPAVRATLRELSREIHSLPGVRAASFSAGSLPMRDEDDWSFLIEGRPRPASPSETPMALVFIVEPEYLDTMGIALKRGRFFTEHDDERAPRVAVIDETFARKFFGADDPIGQRILIGDDPPIQIVGVVGHVKQWGLDTDALQSLQAQLYLPLRGLSDAQIEGTSNVNVVVRTSGSTPAVLNAIRSAVRRQNSQNLISRAETMDSVIAASLARRRFSMALFNAFAVLALLLASIGLYGVTSYVVGQRLHEFGIRIALGAKRRDMLRLVLGRGMKMALAGVAFGLVAALGVTRLMANMLFGVSATDPATFSLIAALLTAVALLACYIPARRATRVDPMVALRFE